MWRVKARYRLTVRWLGLSANRNDLSSSFREALKRPWSMRFTAFLF